MKPLTETFCRALRQRKGLAVTNVEPACTSLRTPFSSKMEPRLFSSLSMNSFCTSSFMTATGILERLRLQVEASCDTLDLSQIAVNLGWDASKTKELFQIEGSSN